LKLHAPFIAPYAAILLAACSSGEGPVEQGASVPASAASSAESASSAVSTASPYTTIDLEACLADASGGTDAAESTCPGFARASLPDAIATCQEVGGKLLPAQQASLQSLDVNGDGQAEFIYNFNENFYCDGAPSVFSCGSLGCPIALFEKRGDTWAAIGSLGESDSIAVEVLAPEPGSAYRTLRGGCAGQRPCEELTYYQWAGGYYQETMIETRGVWVDIAFDGLWTLVEATPVLASPSPDAEVLDHYPVGTEVVVIGDARDAPYKYVSPCNACKSGFIAPAALRKTL
jgi:hypothetical protein